MKGKNNWKVLLGVSAAAVAIITVYAMIERLWVLTAVPIGFLFGFFLQKGDLCGASAFSEVLVMKDRRKVFGLWILIVTAMAAFTFLELLGWVRLNPKPLLYLSYAAGGALFGIGIVLAGGCISGCLYKAAAGNMNSIAALLTIPAGVMAVEFGPLNPVMTAMNRFALPSKNGGPVTLSTISGLPFWALTLLFTAVTIIATFSRRRKKQPPTGRLSPSERWLVRVLRRPWRPWASGLAIGLLMAPAYLSSAATGRNYPLGVTHGVMQAELLLVDRNVQHMWRINPTPASQPTAAASVPARKPVSWWLVLVSLALPLGSWVSGSMNAPVRLMLKPPDEMLTALAGGFLTGVGAAFATGCVVGNIMSGWALMSVGMVLFGVVTILANWMTSYLYLMGGQLAGPSAK